MRRLLLLAILALLLGPVLSQVESRYIGTAKAQEGIQVTVSRVDIDFPSAITFSLEARGPAQITEVLLYYQVQSRGCAPVLTKVFPDFTAGQQVHATYKWDMRKSGGLPPGASVSYFWEVKDSAGQTLRTDKAVLTAEDSRYSWREMQQGLITLEWYQGNEAFARALLDAGVSSLDRLEADTGAKLVEPVTVWVYADSEALRGALVFPQEWTGGISFTSFNIIAIGIPPSGLDWGRRAMVHELAHIAINQASFSCIGSIPSWLSEGLASYAEGSMDPAYASALARGIQQDNLFSVKVLSGSFPTGSQEALLAYAQSYSFVEYLVKEFGPERMLALLETFRSGSTYDGALRSAYGFDSDGLYSRWRASAGLSALAETTPTPGSRVQPLPTIVPFGAASPTPPPPTTATPTPSPTPTIISQPPQPSPTPTGRTGSGCLAPFAMRPHDATGVSILATLPLATLLPLVGIIAIRILSRRGE